MSLGPGTRLGAYEIVALIGAGGMGEVYRARDTRLKRDVAIKVLPDAFANDPDRVRRFDQEARAAAALNHPNIVSIFDICEAPLPQSRHPDRIVFLVSELLEGESLRERLGTGPLAPRKAVDIGGQVARGLAAAHAKGIVHRDLKPENIFVTTEGRAKILDFGLAKLTEREAQSGVAGFGLTSAPTTPAGTQAGLIMGTVGYMAPEQVRGQPADHRSDIFAVGTMLHEMMTGQRAFHRETNAETLTAILKEEPSDAAGAARIPPALKRIVDRCLEKQPDARFQSATDLAFALEGSLGESGGVSVVHGPVSTRTGVRIARWVLAAVIGGALIAAGAFAARRLDPPPAVVRLDLSLPPNTSLFTARTYYVPPFAVSPDGNSMAFAASTAGAATVSSLWVRSLDAPSPRELPDTQGATSPFWSPDSRFIGFFANGAMRTVAASGGPVSSIAPATDGTGTWGTKNTIVFIQTGSQPALYKIAAVGGTPVAIAMPNIAAVIGLSFLPDGEHFVFRGLDVRTQGGAGLYVGSTEGAEPRRLRAADTQANYAGGHLLFGLGTTLMKQPFNVRTLSLSGEATPVADDLWSTNIGVGRFALSANGILALQTATGVSSQLVEADRSGKRLKTLGELANYSNLRLSPDNRRIAVAITDRQARSRDIWVVDVSRGSKVRVTADPSDDLAPAWSPSGEELLFTSQRTGNRDIYRKPAGAIGGEELVVTSPLVENVDDWSPDGRMVLFNGTEAGTTLLHLTGKISKAWRPSPYNTQQGKFSPDGRWIAFQSNNTGEYQIYVAPVSGDGDSIPLSTRGGRFPLWRRDGTELFFLSPEGAVMAVPVRLGDSTVEAGEAAELFRFRPPSIPGRLFDVFADGQRFVLIESIGEDTQPISVVLNWPAMAK